MSTRAALILAALGLAVGCGPTRSRPVSQSEYGADWPLTVLAGELACEEVSSVVFKVGADVYALNGRAKGRAAEKGYKDIRAIQLETVKVGTQQLLASTQPLIAAGLKLCPE
jgi:hypothetical protein